jgi:hypothetical protein
MAESRNFKDLLLALNDCRVEYLIVGGYAVMRYSEPRFTKDLDIWVGHAPDNSRRVIAALARFGAPLRNDGVTEETFSVDHTVADIQDARELKRFQPDTGMVPWGGPSFSVVCQSRNPRQTTNTDRPPHANFRNEASRILPPHQPAR